MRGPSGWEAASRCTHKFAIQVQLVVIEMPLQFDVLSLGEEKQGFKGADLCSVKKG
jgi:hypothetical protein